MKEAKISEIFVSIQGEGLYVGEPQLFIRFYGCNMSCVFCDTRPTTHESFTKDSLLKKIQKIKEPYNSVSITGGEPLRQVDFIAEFLPEYKNKYKKEIHLETNGTLHRELGIAIDLVDVIAMDFKLPSSTKRASFWMEHEKFLKVARKKKVFVKAVITSTTTPGDVLRLAEVIARNGKDIPLVLQPATVVGDNEKVSKGTLERFKNMALSRLTRVEIVEQTHKLLGVK
ncbi:7-carboxy-7-deazaguanine synthase QueE [Candidatus Omnitrophota bacterium]